MTDKEIIKTLERMIRSGEPEAEFASEVLDLINRKNATIEKLETALFETGAQLCSKERNT